MSVLEFNINQSDNSIFERIMKEAPGCVAFSCYIWNISVILRLCSDIKKANGDISIVLGGPEVSFDFEKPLFVDAVLKGECEFAFREYLLGERVSDEYNITENLDSLASPYTDEFFEQNENKIIYYESSRGCPFNCSYCLSCATDGVRYFSMDRVKSDLMLFIKKEIPLVKLCDRTFNANLKRSKEIILFITQNNIKTCFHFEIGADLLDDELISLLSDAPPNYFQIEAGVQTTNPKTLKAINRVTRLENLYANIKALKKSRNIHIHLDLIAGLPFETTESFKRSFNDVIALRPHTLQLGFLKLLRGSSMYSHQDALGLTARDYPPYEIIKNKWLDFKDIILLKGIEQMVDRYYNSKYFKLSVEFLLSMYGADYFSLFFDLKSFYDNENKLYLQMSLFDQFDMLISFCEFKGFNTQKLIDNIKTDYLCCGIKNARPSRARAVLANKELCYSYACEHNLKSVYNNLLFENINGFIYMVNTETVTDIFGRHELIRLPLC